MSASSSTAATSASSLPPTLVDVKLETDRSQKMVVRAFEDLIETVISTIQEPEVTDVGVSAVITSLQTYNAVMNSLLESLPPDVPNGGDMTGASGR